MKGRLVVPAAALLGICAMAAPQLVDRSPWVVWNASGSVPIGLYAVESARELRVGDIVAVRPPQRLAEFLADGGYLPRGVLLLKHVAALAGQSACRSELTITVDATVVGEARERDGRGRPLPVWQGCRVLASNEVFLMNPLSTDSLDGRYFGSLPAAAIVGRASPLWIAPAEDKE